MNIVVPSKFRTYIYGSSRSCLFGVEGCWHFPGNLERDLYASLTRSMSHIQPHTLNHKLNIIETSKNSLQAVPSRVPEGPPETKMKKNLEET